MHKNVKWTVLCFLIPIHLFAQTPGTLKWRYETGSLIESSPAIGTDGTVYVGSWDNYLHAVNSDGTEKWKYQTGLIDSSPAIGPDGTVYIGSYDDYLYAFNPDGTLKWRYQTGDNVGTPAVGIDGTVYIGSPDHILDAINPDGTLKWRFQEVSFSSSSSPAIDIDGTIYVVWMERYLYAIKADGSLKWRWMGYWGIYSSPAIGSDGTVYVGSSPGLYAINPDGTFKWFYQTGSHVGSPPAIGADGTVYVGCWDDYLYALDPNGALKWRYKTDGDIDSSPAIGTDGIIYVGSKDDHLYAINPDSTLKWRYKTERGVDSSPAIGTDGTVYVGSDDFYLHAVFSSSQGLAASSWPKFQRDNQNHSNRVNLYIINQNNFLFLDPNQGFEQSFSLVNCYTDAVAITGLTFAHPGFSLMTALPLIIPADDDTAFTCNVFIDTSGYYQAAFDLDYTMDSEDITAKGFLNLGLFAEDGSERTHVAHRIKTAYDSCKAVDPFSAATKNNIGLLYRMLGETGTAESAVASALSQTLYEKYGYTGVKMNMGVIKSDQDSTGKADYYYTSAYADVWYEASESSLSPPIDYNQAWEAYRSGNLSEALVRVNLTIGHAKTNDFLMAKAFVLRGAIHYAQDDVAQARSDFEQAVGLDPDGPIGRMAQENIDALDTGIHDMTDGFIPDEYMLLPNYPNPFNPETVIDFGLPESCHLEISVYNLLGKRVKTLVERPYNAGWHRAVWHGDDESGSRVGSGVYLLKLSSEKFEKTIKMSLLR